METDTAVRREVLTSRGQAAFYRACYARLGYRVEREETVGREHTIVFLRDGGAAPEALERAVAGKLRLIELAERKRRGFGRLFWNLALHLALFCVQGAILYRLRLETAHPRVMLQVGVLLFLVFLAAGFALKVTEVLRWGRTVRALKADVDRLLSAPAPREPAPPAAVLSVLFTRGHGPVSELIYWVSGRQYTHASLGLGAANDCFYSFDARGFRVEHPAHRKLRDGRRESLCYQFRVTPEEYRQVEEAIRGLLAQRETLRYNLAGAVFGVLHLYLPVKSGRVFFCSEFVSQQLRGLGSFRLKKAPGMYLPTNLAKSLIQQENLYRVLVNEV